MIIYEDMIDRVAVVTGAAQPKEIADLIMYLCSEKASFITGHNYVIDGGRCWGTR